MKFGQNLHLYQIPEWEPFYISYKELKKLFNSAVKKAFQLRTEPSFTGPPINPLLWTKTLTLT
jgi:SPX domain protein involved in polyphosphate accumulation